MRPLSEETFKNPLLYIIILIIGFGMRLVNLTDGLWLDEIWSMVMSAPDISVPNIIDACKVDSHPPLFDIILHYFLVVFGDNDINGRFLALFIGLLGILATFYYTLKISNSYFAAFLSFAMISLSYFHIYYSIEGRFYTLLYLFSITIISEFYLFLKDKKLKNLIWFVLASVLLVYTHYYGAILVFALYLILLFLWLIKEVDRKSFFQMAGGGIVIFVSFLPWLPFMFAGQQKESWMLNPGIGDVFDYLYKYSGKNPVEFLFVILALIMSVKLWKTNVKLYAILFGTILLGFFIPFFVSYLTIPMLHYRYTFIYFPAIIIIVSVFWKQTQMLNAKNKIIVFSIVFLSILINFFFISPYTKGEHGEPWREIARDVAKFNYSDKEDIYTEVGFYLDYYLDRNGHKKALKLPVPENENAFWYLKSPFDAQNNAVDTLIFEADKTIDYGKEFLLFHYVRTKK